MEERLFPHRIGLKLARILLDLGLDHLGPSQQLVERRFLLLEVILEFGELGLVGSWQAVLAHHVTLLFAIDLDRNTFTYYQVINYDYEYVKYEYLHMQKITVAGYRYVA